MPKPTDPTLVRALSTGHTGTKFVAGAFAAQGYESHHEDIYKGEPTSALFAYLKMLGDAWKQDPERYYHIESDFAQPYLRTVQGLLQGTDEETTSSLFKLFSRPSETSKRSHIPNVVVDCDNRLTLATPLVLQAAGQAGLTVKHLILYRNPLKTIHAIYKVEAPNYNNRPASFSAGEEVVRAANVWANVYGLLHQQMLRFGSHLFKPVDLEPFTWQEDYTRSVFDFLGLDFDLPRFNAYRDQTMKAPYRSWKYDSDRNSDLFHDPGFMFSQAQITAILAIIKDVLSLYQIDPDQMKEEYLSFHNRQKADLKFN